MSQHSNSLATSESTKEHPPLQSQTLLGADDRGLPTPILATESPTRLSSSKEECPHYETPWSSVGYVTYKRSYSRDGEEWTDTVQRVLTGLQGQLGVGYSDSELRRLRDYHLRLKGTVAGRFLWQLGTHTVNKLGLASLQNCWCLAVDKPSAFTKAFDLLMLGGGVGYNIQREYVEKLPTIQEGFRVPVREDTASAAFVVPDTREGWVQLLRLTLDSAFGGLSEQGYTQPLRYSAQLIRSKGTPIRGFGGVASGPTELCDGIGAIGRILERARGRRLRPVECLDIMNLIGQIVVSGNVRRSAQIAIGDYDDEEFLRAKRWDLGDIPSWRSMSNNSVNCDDIRKLPHSFWEGYSGNGEPYGLVNLDLARKAGRCDGDRVPSSRSDERVVGFNPCAEIALEDGEPCCLATIFLPNVESYDELVDLATLLYRACKHSLDLGSHYPDTTACVARNRRIGLSISGYLGSTEEQKGWLSKCYEHLRSYDKAYSEARGWPASIRLTCVQPSGTLSLLPGVYPGCHPGYARYMLRRIQFASNSPLVDVLREHGYDTELRKNLDGSADPTTVVGTFPFRYTGDGPVAGELSAIEQLEVVRRLQREWADNAVSCTVYYRKEELQAIREYLDKYWADNFKSLSFLLHSDHGFEQAPFEEITKEQYEAYVERTQPIVRLSTRPVFESGDECAGGACPIR